MNPTCVPVSTNAPPTAASPAVPPATDEQLLAAYVEGDPSAFALLVHRHERDLFRFLRRFCGDASAAEDVFQETFLQVHQSAGTFDPTKHFRPWLFTIAANKARDMLRARARRRTLSYDMAGDHDGAAGLIDALPDAAAGPLEQAESADLNRRVTGVVNGMPLIHREVLLLAYYHQFPYRQISQVMGLPLGTVKSRLHVAVRAFARAWVATQRTLDPRRN